MWFMLTRGGKVAYLGAGQPDSAALLPHRQPVVGAAAALAAPR